MMLELEDFRKMFTYEPDTGALLLPGGGLATKAAYVKFDGCCFRRSMRYGRLCYWLHYGYLPRVVKHRNGDFHDTRAINLYDPEAPQGLQEWLEWVESQKGTAQ